MTTRQFLVETDWLMDRLDDPSVSIVDGSWYLPNMNRNGAEEYTQQHIPGAVFFDIDKITEPGSPLPHTLASPEIFADAIGKMGISDRDTIVVYDGMGLFSAARVWWNFRVMGAKEVFILNGGLPQWIAEEKPLAFNPDPVQQKVFSTKFDSSTVLSLEDTKTLVDKGDIQIADARPEERFLGNAPEPRPGVKSGHMPGAHSLPFSKLAIEGKLLSPAELELIFKDAGIDLAAPVVTTCGSGVTAAALTLALETLGHENHGLYDGSWAEWGERDDTEIVVGTS